MWSFPKSWPKFVPTSAWKIPYTMTMSPKPERQGGISVHPFPRRSIRTPWRPLCTVTLTPKVIRCCPLWYHIRTICIAELAGISRDRFGTTTKSSSKQYFPIFPFIIRVRAVAAADETISRRMMESVYVKLF